jgi:hypothetical protein
MQLINKYKTKTIGRRKILVVLRCKQTGAGTGDKTNKSVWNRGQYKPKQEGDWETRTLNQ